MASSADIEKADDIEQDGGNSTDEEELEKRLDEKRRKRLEKLRRDARLEI